MSVHYACRGDSPSSAGTILTTYIMSPRPHVKMRAYGKGDKCRKFRKENTRLAYMLPLTYSALSPYYEEWQSPLRDS